MPQVFALESPVFQPAMRVISAITNAANAEVTTTFDHDYASGMIVRIMVSKADGMEQINTRTGTITVTSPTTFTIDIDTRLFDVFAITSPAHKNTYSMVLPIGEINSILTQATRNVL